MRGWEATDSTPAKQPETANFPPIPDPNTRGPYMHAAMPLMASTNDALSQFYSNANIPWQRILPAKKGGQSQ